MAKLTGALMSMGARGQIGKALTVSRWRGIAYAKSYSVPSNPRTQKQQSTRTTFSTLSAVWKGAPEILRAPWNEFARNRSFLPRNAIIGQNIRAMRGEADMSDFVGSPSALGGAALLGVTATPGDGSITVEPEAPDPDTGWTIKRAVAVAIPNGNPSEPLKGPIRSGSADADPWEFEIDGLENDQEYVVSAWLEWERPDGKTAFGASVNANATPTA